MYNLHGSGPNHWLEGFTRQDLVHRRVQTVSRLPRSLTDTVKPASVLLRLGTRSLFLMTPMMMMMMVVVVAVMTVMIILMSKMITATQIHASEMQRVYHKGLPRQIHHQVMTTLSIILSYLASYISTAAAAAAAAAGFGKILCWDGDTSSPRVCVCVHIKEWECMTDFTNYCHLEIGDERKVAYNQLLTEWHRGQHVPKTDDSCELSGITLVTYSFHYYNNNNNNYDDDTFATSCRCSHINTYRHSQT